MTDLVMPVMDGFEATRQLRTIPKLQKVPIIAASASVFESDKKQSFDVGCDDFMAKPFHVNELLDKIRIHLDLIWIYEQQSHPIDKIVAENSTRLDYLAGNKITEFVGPSSTQAAILFDLAMMGDIGGILEEIDQFEQSDKKLIPFCRKIRQLANTFDEEQICELVEPYKETT
ncbi:two-component hybrid sensor and regulator [Beggiatoa sp. PS]|nr:two-component hybrid sensor and regulator [Beggiatoa sp. PS]